jgi:hypothetical protein
MISMESITSRHEKQSHHMGQVYVHATITPFYKKWPQIKCFPYMDDLLIAHPSFTLLQQALRDLDRCLAKKVYI